MEGVKIKIEYIDEDVIIDKTAGINFFMNVGSELTQLRIINDVVPTTGTVLNQYFRDKPVKSVQVLVNGTIVKSISNIVKNIYHFSISDILYESIDFIVKVGDNIGNS
jgi:hypothetical protein